MPTITENGKWDAWKTNAKIQQLHFTLKSTLVLASYLKNLKVCVCVGGGVGHNLPAAVE